MFRTIVGTPTHDESVLPGLGLDEATALGDSICALAGQISAATCRWLRLLADFDARAGWVHWGQASCADWVAWRCSMSLVTAREHVRIARWLVGQEVIGAAFSRGELSYSKVRALARLAEIRDPRATLAMAREATAAQLERIVAATRRVTRGEAAVAYAARSLSAYVDDDGALVLRARIPGPEGELVLRALEHALAQLDAGAEDEAADSREPLAARNADALVLLADTALAAPAAARTGGDRCQVVVHVDVATLSVEDAASAGDDSAASLDAMPLQQRACHLENGPAIAAETARRLCCDAGVVTSVERGGSALSVGRRTRSIPPAIRRALRRRDACCAFPGCTRTRWLDAHHIQHWARGGETSLANLVHLCHHHHQLVHEGGYGLGRTRDGVLFTTPDGRHLAAVPAPRRSGCAGLLEEHGRGGPRPGPWALAPQATAGGTRWDLGLAVDSLVSAAIEYRSPAASSYASSAVPAPNPG